MQIIVQKVGKTLGYGACYKGEEARGNIGRGATAAEAIADFKTRFQAAEDQRLEAERNECPELRDMPRDQIIARIQWIAASLVSLDHASLRVDTRALSAVWRDDLRALRLELAMRRPAAQEQITARRSAAKHIEVAA